MDPAHVWRDRGGVPRCVTCAQTYQNSYRRQRTIARQRQRVGLLRAGESERSNFARLAWETRRQRFTPEDISSAIRAGLARRKAVHGEWRRASRTSLRGGRPEWVQVGSGRVSLKARDAFYVSGVARLRVEMIAAHPDKHPGLVGAAWERQNERFDAARKALQKFAAAQSAQFAAIGWPPPGVAKMRSAAA